MGEGRRIEEALDQIRWARLAQPQKDGLPVLQQKQARVCETFLRAPDRSRHRLAANVYSLSSHAYQWDEAWVELELNVLHPHSHHREPLVGPVVSGELSAAH
ncbi:hypothetical protein XENOCAPTIV_000364 [Xenoophorus captivus]|uniref:Uncharacterized protein n=1 Tax=Xenoophorus captivus TaxID=1517983 RepID=A0ABV0QDL9_9TELE